MRKFTCFLLLCVVLMVLTACVTEPFERPVPGVWVSNNPAITINIPPDHITQYGPSPSTPYGIYIRNDEEVEILPGFGFRSNILTIHNAVFIRSGGHIGDNPFFSGRITIDGDRFYFSLNPRWQEEHGISEIVFIRIGDYEGTPTE